MTLPNGGPWGPVPRYTVLIELPTEGREIRLRSCTSQGPHAAAAAAVVWLHDREPSAEIGNVEIELVEDSYHGELDDIVDYWDVA